MIYDRRKQIVCGILVSMVRSDEDMHLNSPSTGEVIVTDANNPDYGDSTWVGHAAQAGDVFRLCVQMAQNGEDIDSINEAFLPEF